MSRIVVPGCPQRRDSFWRELRARTRNGLEWCKFGSWHEFGVRTLLIGGRNRLPANLIPTPDYNLQRHLEALDL